MPVDLRFGKDRVQRLRKRLSLTQTAFADTVGVAQSSVSLWENGERTPEGATVLARLWELETSLPSQDGDGA